MRRLLEFFGFGLGMIVNLVTIISVVSLDEIVSDHKVLYSILFIGIAMIFFMISSVYFVLTYRRTIGYAPAMKHMGLGFSKIHDLNRQPRKTTPAAQGAEITRTLKELCDHFAQALTMINYHPVAVCVKFLYAKEGKLIVSTLARDATSASQNRKYGGSDKVEHWVNTRNSGFYLIYERMFKSHVEPFLFQRFLPWKKGYQNTRLDPSWNEPRIPIVGFIWRQIRWPLPYRSAITVPIVPLDPNLHDPSAIRGYLCIDSNRNWSFSRRYDVDLIRGMADGIYNQVDELYRLSHPTSANHG